MIPHVFASPIPIANQQSGTQQPTPHPQSIPHTQASSSSSSSTPNPPAVCSVPPHMQYTYTTAADPPMPVTSTGTGIPTTTSAWFDPLSANPLLFYPNATTGGVGMNPEATSFVSGEWNGMQQGGSGGGAEMWNGNGNGQNHNEQGRENGTGRTSSSSPRDGTDGRGQ